MLDAPGRNAAVDMLRGRAEREGMSAREKDRLLAELAGRLDIDYEALCARRVLHIMNAAELKELADAGVDLQLHTHRHRVKNQAEMFLKEIEDNRRALAAVSAAETVHFCYPGGKHKPEFERVLRTAGVESATTCKSGLASRRSNRFFLPRVLDTSGTAQIEFEAWISGLAAWVPRRRVQPPENQRLEYKEPR
jgi:hypothetical protein